jgi:hypothetical protein
MWLKSDHHSYKTIAAAYPRANTAKSVPTSFAALSTRFANSLITVPSVLGCLAFEIGMLKSLLAFGRPTS